MEDDIKQEKLITREYVPNIKTKIRRLKRRVVDLNIGKFERSFELKKNIKILNIKLYTYCFENKSFITNNITNQHNMEYINCFV
jgi:hypothetical protein